MYQKLLVSSSEEVFYLLNVLNQIFKKDIYFKNYFENIDKVGLLKALKHSIDPVRDAANGVDNLGKFFI